MTKMADKGDLLIAEDDEVLRGIYVKKFTIAGYTLRTASTGNETISEIQKKVPDLLILDINMPDVDGFAVLEQYPKEKRPFPVILLTNFGDEHNRERGKELGAEDYFVKSEMTIRKLLEMVETIMKAKTYWKNKLP